ncbi:hypothetical protein SACC_27870 [Saccharolobus caldissimus]|uniref:Uncharacterized protein n=1 Tax=Saccharolobus caldissimus TaxID=1702097 RepID=A0AAQ4CVD9_9CREN|nr:hypothetical protein SACC_27870 [Saccharolobus caldissimus]
MLMLSLIALNREVIDADSRLNNLNARTNEIRNKYILYIIIMYLFDFMGRIIAHNNSNIYKNTVNLKILFNFN